MKLVVFLVLFLAGCSIAVYQGTLTDAHTACAQFGGLNLIIPDLAANGQQRYTAVCNDGSRIKRMARI